MVDNKCATIWHLSHTPEITRLTYFQPRKNQSKCKFWFLVARSSKSINNAELTGAIVINQISEINPCLWVIALHQERKKHLNRGNGGLIYNELLVLRSNQPRQDMMQSMVQSPEIWAASFNAELETWRLGVWGRETAKMALTTPGGCNMLFI